MRRPLVWPPLVETLAAAADHPERLYLVGGVVRDALLGIPSLDLDLAADGSGLRIARRIANRIGGAYYPVDAERGTGRIVFDDAHVDIATFRGPTLEADLAGRDFTINAIAVPLSDPEHIIDPLGGEHDLLVERVLRQCSPTSISDDAIRALRAVRQAVQFRLRMAPQTTDAVRAAAAALVDESGNLAQPERVRGDIFKMLKLGRMRQSMRLMHALGLLAVVSPGPIKDEQIDLLRAVETLLVNISSRRDDNSAADLLHGTAVMVLDRYRRQLQEHSTIPYPDGRMRAGLLALATLAAEQFPAEDWSDQLRLSRDERRVLAGIDRARELALRDWEPPDVRDIHRYFRATGEEGIDGILLRLAEILTQGIDPADWGYLLDKSAGPLLHSFFRAYQQIIAPPPLLTGTDLMAELAVEPGPLVGEVLAVLLEEQAAGTITTREEALLFVEHYISE
ncbi:MAG: CCA tRNA nucleotidyltransferase [Chloroflexi bacterium]|nr:CCA tRNA nucleotidyltransferase [Chloroflexota bacterium]